MIDRSTRDALATELRHFAAGLTTNDEFEERVESLPRDDRAIGAILHAAWYLYDDLRTHRLRDRWALSRLGKREVATWILFLKTDLEYEWPFPSLWPFRTYGQLASAQLFATVQPRGLR